jgi:hypothetical protein
MKMAKKHVTKVVRGEVSHGIKAPAPQGLCHAAWKVFDALTKVEGDEVKLPVPFKAIAKGVEKGLNRGNLRIEFPRWKRYNGFAV